MTHQPSYPGGVITRFTGVTCLGILLAAYHIACRQLLIAFEQQRNRHSHKWYRVFNEIPVFALLAALYLVLFKPF